MLDYHDKVLETAAYIEEKIPEKPIAGLMTGTGLGDCGQSLAVSVSLPYEDIPHFPITTVQSHDGQFLAGKMANRPVIVMQGRFHLYEGYSSLDVTFPVRLMQALGVETLFVTNAAGGLNPAFRPGNIMIIKDHINLSGTNPLVGPNHDDWGERFPDMTEAYDKQLMALAEEAGKDSTIPLRKGVYAGLLGPSLETPAEVRFLKAIGAEAVGFSTTQEVIAAVHARIKVLGLSIITNVNDPEHPEPANVEKIINIAKAAAPQVDQIIRSVVEKL
ncbi:MAG: purine-nucleoside phosphorylase [Desulfobacterales bacterium]|nr:purine-nucleoside phosphorylase [Desulfobacterales bacterium]MDX2511885.1 purine-nucleoside phosphorylase [Desulfobacterales bacterium]